MKIHIIIRYKILTHRIGSDNVYMTRAHLILRYSILEFIRQRSDTMSVGNKLASPLCQRDSMIDTLEQ